MRIVSELNLPFYLTGGTALSRYYFKHRYSDDLDLFVNSNPNYKNYIRQFISALETAHKSGKLVINYDKLMTSDDYTQVIIEKNEAILKIDLVNDIDIHFGEIEGDIKLGRVDSWRNILSNKISAIFRFEIKDYVDIWMIAKNKKFNWKQITYEAKQKEAAVDPVEIFELFKSFPFQHLNLIKWKSDFKTEMIKNDFDIISNDIFYGRENSLSI